MNDDEEMLTAYHEAGHAVIGFALGATIESVQLWGEADENLPERFGDCRVNWGKVDPHTDWQRQREVLTILAGPVAEMIYTGTLLPSQPPTPEMFASWQHDFQLADQIAGGLEQNLVARGKLIRRLIASLHEVMFRDGCWAAVAAVADELAAHELAESDRIDEIVGFWLRRS